jgi:molybdate transport system substrate-binding protein
LDATLKGMSHPDLVLLPDDVMEKLIQSGHVQADTRQPIGQVGLAVVVRSGAAKPDVSTPEALKQVLGSAKSIVYGDPEESLGGRQAAQVIARLGMADRLKDRITLASGANPMLQVSMGAAELGLHAMHEALETSGVTVAGPVPGPLQPWTRYTMALVADAANESEARQLMDWLAGSAGRTLLQAQGVWRLP